MPLMNQHLINGNVQCELMLGRQDFLSSLNIYTTTTLPTLLCVCCVILFGEEDN